MSELFHATVLALIVFGVVSYYRMKRENVLLRSMINDQWATIDRLQQVWIGVVDSGMVKQRTFFDLKAEDETPLFRLGRTHNTPQTIHSSNGVSYIFDPAEIRKAQDTGKILVRRTYYSHKGRPSSSDLWINPEEFAKNFVNTSDGRQYRDEELDLVVVK